MPEHASVPRLHGSDKPSLAAVQAQLTLIWHIQSCAAGTPRLPGVGEYEAEQAPPEESGAALLRSRLSLRSPERRSPKAELSRRPRASREKRAYKNDSAFTVAIPELFR